MSRVRTWGLVLLAVVAFVSGCGEKGGPSPLDRQAITTAFSRIGEPLAIHLDVKAAYPAFEGTSAASIDVIYESVSAATVRAVQFQIHLFDDEDSARTSRIEAVTGGTLGTLDPHDVVQRKNAVMILGPAASARRRDKLIATLESL